MRVADVLLPRSRALHKLQAQRIVMIGHGGEHQANILDQHIRAKLQDQGNAPPASLP